MATSRGEGLEDSSVIPPEVRLPHHPHREPGIHEPLVPLLVCRSVRRRGVEGQAVGLRAGEALGGYVFKPVGLATHYHTDWVYPYWSPELDKLARVETHLFFRWSGYWGTRPAFASVYRGNEPDPAALVGAADATLPGAAPLPTAVADAPKIESGTVVMRNTSGKANFILLAGTAPADALAAARMVCNQPGTCRVLGWADPAAIPQAFPIPPSARAALQFSYSRDPSGTEIALYGCGHFAGIPREQCIPRAR